MFGQLKIIKKCLERQLYYDSKKITKKVKK